MAAAAPRRRLRKPIFIDSDDDDDFETKMTEARARARPVCVKSAACCRLWRASAAEQA
jgi:hypothetical protein